MALADVHYLFSVYCILIFMTGRLMFYWILLILEFYFQLFFDEILVFKAL